MSDLVSLIIALFSILITVLLLAVASIAILLLLSVFLFVSIVVGVRQQSVFKGLRIFIFACAISIITPTAALFFKFNLAEAFGLTMSQGLWAGAVSGLVISIVFSALSYKFFRKASDICYRYIDSKIRK